MRRGRRAPRQEGSRPSGRGGHLRSQWVASPASADPRVRAESTLQDAALGGGGSAGGSTDPPAGSEAQNSGCLFGGDPGKTQRTGAGARGTLASLTRLGSRGGEWAAVPPPLGGGGGAQTKGACAFKAGSPGAGGEGTSGSGVEGGCAGQQGRGRGPEALRRGGRDSRDARARSRTAGRPAGRPEPAGAAVRRPRAGADPGQVSEGSGFQRGQRSEDRVVWTVCGALGKCWRSWEPGAPRVGLEASTLVPRHELLFLHSPEFPGLPREAGKTSTRGGDAPRGWHWGWGGWVWSVETTLRGEGGPFPALTLNLWNERVVSVPTSPRPVAGWAGVGCGVGRLYSE